MDFPFPTGSRRISVQVTNPDHVMELQTAVIQNLDDPESVMKNMRITKVIANCFGDDVALTISLLPTNQAKMFLLQYFVQNVNNCRLP